MNVYDSERMADVLAQLGYVTVATPDTADMVILNTCHIRDRAAEKVFSELGKLRLIKDARSASGLTTVIAVAGCVGQAEGAALLTRAPYVDIVLGPQTYHRLPEMLTRASHGAGSVIETDFKTIEKFDTLPVRSRTPQISRFLTIQEGCDKFCSFCVVPYTRGAETSRPAAAVLAETRQLIASGAREVCLLGQNVNAWAGIGPDGSAWTMARLVRAVADIPGVLRIRYTTSHPRDMDDNLIAAHGEVPQLMPFLHLPVQSGSDNILSAMNRQHTVKEYYNTVRRLRSVNPELALSSDFIVGYPGETDDDFTRTLALVQQVGFAQSFTFKYSTRPGTPAARLSGQVAEAVKDERLQRLQSLLRKQAATYNMAAVGSTIPVLVTHVGRRPGQVGGRTPAMQSVHFAAPEMIIGTEVAVRIVEATPTSLTGHLEQELACA